MVVAVMTPSPSLAGMTAKLVSLNKGADIFSAEENLTSRTPPLVWVLITISSTLSDDVQQSFLQESTLVRVQTPLISSSIEPATAQVLTSMQLCTAVLVLTCFWVALR